MPSIVNGNGRGPLKVIIAGAGIGGLVTAIALHAIGLDIHIYEAARELKTAGVGINLQPHAVLVLRNLGLLDDLEEQGIQTAEVVYLNCHGQQILTEKRGKGAGYEVPQYSIHRGEFHALLLRRAKALLGDSRIHLGHAFQSFKDNGDSVTVNFIDRYTGRDIGTATSDILVACDGINSAARKQLYPNEGPAKFSGRMLWRASVEDVPFLTGKSRQEIHRLPHLKTSPPPWQVNHQLDRRITHRSSRRPRYLSSNENRLDEICTKRDFCAGICRMGFRLVERSRIDREGNRSIRISNV